MEEIEVTYGDIKFIIVGEFIEAETGSWESPSFPPHFDIHMVEVNGECIEYMLNQHTLDKLEELVLDKLEK